jgi:glutamine synthetase
MLPEEVCTAAQARVIVEERDLTHVKVGVFDNDDNLRGKLIDRTKFFAALEKGLGFCGVVLGWGSNDQLCDNITLSGWHTACPSSARLTWATLRRAASGRNVRYAALSPTGELARYFEII